MAKTRLLSQSKNKREGGKSSKMYDVTNRHYKKVMCRNIEHILPMQMKMVDNEV